MSTAQQFSFPAYDNCPVAESRKERQTIQEEERVCGGKNGQEAQPGLWARLRGSTWHRGEHAAFPKVPSVHTGSTRCNDIYPLPCSLIAKHCVGASVSDRCNSLLRIPRRKRSGTLNNHIHRHFKLDRITLSEDLIGFLE